MKHMELSSLPYLLQYRNKLLPFLELTPRRPTLEQRSYELQIKLFQGRYNDETSRDTNTQRLVAETLRST